MYVFVVYIPMYCVCVCGVYIPLLNTVQHYETHIHVRHESVSGILPPLLPLILMLVQAGQPQAYCQSDREHIYVQMSLVCTADTTTSILLLCAKPFYILTNSS